MGGQAVTNVGYPSQNNHAATKYYVDQIREATNDMEGQKIIHVGTPTEATDAATKIYVDTAVAGSAAASAVVTGARVAQWVRALS